MPRAAPAPATSSLPHLLSRKSRHSASPSLRGARGTGRLPGMRSTRPCPTRRYFSNAFALTRRTPAGLCRAPLLQEAYNVSVSSCALDAKADNTSVVGIVLQASACPPHTVLH